ncbi:MAG TPA: ribosome silencing factor [Anaerolineaceae bacterium]|nr:ribosome silencing factor [Anaerolineaceae bacterium]
MNFLEEKKAEKILLLDIRELTTFTDYFILCNGTSDRMLQALSNSLREFVKQEYEFNVQLEGESRDGWIVADLEDIVIHFFSPELRNYYKLEQLWSKGRVILNLQ